MQEFRKRGQEVYGIEPNEIKFKEARREFADNVVQGVYDPEHFRSKDFNTFVLWHVLEHLNSINGTILNIKEQAPIHHKMVVAVPISSSFQARMYGKRWFHYFSPLHITNFSEKGLHDLFSRHGYQLESVTHGDFIANLEGHIFSLFNILGVRHNFAFNFLQRQFTIGFMEVMLFMLVGILSFVIMPGAFFLTVWEMAVKNSGCPVFIYGIRRN